MLPDGLLTTLLRDLLDPGGHGLDSTFLAGAAQDMKARVAGMPRYMGAGITALTLALASTGYQRWPQDRRLGLLSRLRTAPVSPLRDFIEFYEKMGTFVYYSRVEHAGSHGGHP